MSDAVKAMFRPKPKASDAHAGNADFFGRTFTRVSTRARSVSTKLIGFVVRIIGRKGADETEGGLAGSFWERCMRDIMIVRIYLL